MLAARKAAEVLGALDPEQRAAVEAGPGPVCILAGAGTGKTRTITHRIAYLVLTGQVSPNAVLAVTHSAQAAGELRDRVRELGVAAQARTFHSVAMRQLRHFWQATGLPGDELTLLQADNGDQNNLLRRVLSWGPAAVTAVDVAELRGEIQWAKRRRLSPVDYPEAAKAAGRSGTRSAEELAAAFERYEVAKRDHAVLDFDDVIEQCSILLEGNEDIAAEVRAQYSCFVVDEYQDTDRAHERLLAAWLGPRDNVTVVGDPNQTIYSFKGAAPELLAGFATRHPDAVEISLNRDYRSTPQIVAAANRLMAHSAAGVKLKGQQPDGPELIRREYESETSELDGLADRITDLLGDGVPAAEVAVLVRTNTQIAKVRERLTKAGVRAEVFDDKKFFEIKEIRQALAALTDYAARVPGAPGLNTLREVLKEFDFDSDGPPAQLGKARVRWDNLNTLFRLTERLPTDVTKTTTALVGELRRRAEADYSPRLENVVTLATMHKAKGLEWDAVFLPGLTKGFMPIVHATTSADVEEERRLLYVAVTRARQRLEYSYAAHSDGGRPNSPSPFLAALAPDRPAGRSRPQLASAQGEVKYATGDRVLTTAFGIGRVKTAGRLEAEVDFGSSIGVRKVRIKDLSAL